LMIVMFLGGLWHGASWNFIIWGVLHGSYLAVHKILVNKFPSLANNLFFKTKGGKILSIFVTQYFIFLAWIAFRVQNLDHLTYSLQKYVLLDFQYTQTIEIILTHKISIGVMILFIILHYIIFKKQDLKTKISNLPLPFWIIFLFSVSLSILLLYDGNPEDFIYFKF